MSYRGFKLRQPTASKKTCVYYYTKSSIFRALCAWFSSCGKVKLFVADAKYRASDLIYDSSLKDHANPNITASDFCINGSADDPKQALTYNKTDTELQNILSAFENDDAAWINTNALVKSSTAKAAHHCRSQNISGIGTLDLPNLYELVVMYLEADNIDALDPTFNSNKLMGLGMKSTNGRFSSGGTGRGYWSSTEYSSQYAWGIWCDGTLIGRSNWQNKSLCVAPVKELSIS